MFHHCCLVDKLVSMAIENKSDAQLVARLFNRVVSRRLCSPASFGEGFVSVAQALDYIAIYAPQAFERIVIMLKGAHLYEDDECCKRLSSKSRNSGMLLLLLVPSC
ncbi:hypothetical protein A0H81_10305 [Grifola frondosa]|uniref:MI domain-containing protein n=1 Tax=Grifola frondosa TaxID=5627 RepID=A0A1C7LYR6_GRIFR|nr:hypothetical protein A0H81_10305 [Grifola frondosa]